MKRALIKRLGNIFGRKVSLLVLASVILMSAPSAFAADQKNGNSKGKTQTTASKSTGSKTKNSKSTGSKSGGSKSSKSKKSNKGTKTAAKQETSADVKKQQAATAREIKQTEQQIKENNAAVKKSLNELGKLEGDIDVSKKKVEAAGAKVTALQEEIGKLEAQISKDEQSLAKLRAEYLKAVKAMRAKKKEQSSLAFVFSSKNFNEALRRMRYLKQFSSWRAKQTDEIGKRVESLKQQTAQLQQTKKMRDNELAVEVKERNNLQAQYVKQDALVVELKKNGQALQSHLAKKQAEANALKGRIASLIAEEQRKAEAERVAREKAEAERQAKAEAERQKKLEAERHAKEEAERMAKDKAAQKEKDKADKAAKEKAEKDLQAQKNKEKKKEDTKKGQEKKGDDVSYAEARKRRPKDKAKSESTGQNAPKQGKRETPAKTSTPATPAAGTNFESMRGSLPRPVAGHFKVTSRFGRQTLPDLPGVSYDNPGIDAEVASGASAQAVYAGKVSGVYMVPGYSTVVIVSHGNYYTVYGNLSAASVKVGDSVKQGQTLGKVAADEDDSSHGSIHFEVWKNRDKLDPLSWIR